MDNYEILKETAIQEGITLLGVADIRKVKNYFNIQPPSILDKLDYGISIGYRLSDPVIDGIVNEPTKIYSYHYRQVNLILDQVSLKICAVIHKMGHSSLPIPSSQVIDWEKQVGHLSHKMVGVLAGMGWIGRSALLINPTYGARVRYATILTDLPLTTDNPIDGDCGECTLCIDTCPANAIGKKKEDFNMLSCLDKLKSFGKWTKTGLFICGICLKACPGSTKS